MRRSLRAEKAHLYLMWKSLSTLIFVYIIPYISREGSEENLQNLRCGMKNGQSLRPSGGFHRASGCFQERSQAIQKPYAKAQVVMANADLIYSHTRLQACTMELHPKAVMKGLEAQQLRGVLCIIVLDLLVSGETLNAPLLIRSDDPALSLLQNSFRRKSRPQADRSLMKL